MPVFTFEDGVAIAQLIFYVICLPVSFLVCTRHGMDKALGWYFLLSFSLIRVIGNACRLAAINQNANSNVEEVALITAFMGLSPLLMASLGLVARLHTSREDSHVTGTAQTQVIRLTQLICVVAFILFIVGATNGSLATLYDQTSVKVGVALYIVVWLALTGLYLAIFGAILRGSHERPLKIALGISLPLLLIRVIYSNIRCNISHGPGSVFADATKSGLVGLFIGTLEEMATVVVYLWAGLNIGRGKQVYQTHQNLEYVKQDAPYQPPFQQGTPHQMQYGQGYPNQQRIPHQMQHEQGYTNRQGHV